MSTSLLNVGRFLPSAVRRYVLPKLHALNFVLENVLYGGVTQALNLDSHGKILSYRLLGLSIAVPDELVRFTRCVPKTSSTLPW